jgi:hypothetical protein
MTVERICTFGVGHTHPVTGEDLMGAYVRITAADELEVRRIMHQYFGARWAWLYRSEEEAGVDTYGLREIPLPAGSPFVTGGEA